MKGNSWSLVPTMAWLCVVHKVHLATFYTGYSSVVDRFLLALSRILIDFPLFMLEPF